MKKNITKIVTFICSFSVTFATVCLTSCKPQTSYYWSFKNYENLTNFTNTQKFISLTSKKPAVQDIDENSSNFVNSKELGATLENILTAGDMAQIMIYSLFNFFQIISFTEFLLDHRGPQFNPNTDVSNIFLAIVKNQNSWVIKMGFDFNDGKQIKKPFVSYNPDAPQWKDNQNFIGGLDVPPEPPEYLPYDIFVTFFDRTKYEYEYWNTNNWAQQIIEGFGTGAASFIEDLIDNEWVTLLEWQFKIIFPNWELKFFDNQKMIKGGI